MRIMIPAALYATVTTTLTLCPTSATILPVRKLTPVSSGSTSALTTGITYHQGVVASNDSASFPGICNAQVVASGELTAGFCAGLHTYAVSIARLQGMECAFKMFHGSAACEADATDTMNVPLPSGDGAICLITGVEDGGKFMKASGFLVCG